MESVIKCELINEALLKTPENTGRRQVLVTRESEGINNRVLLICADDKLLFSVWTGKRFWARRIVHSQKNDAGYFSLSVSAALPKWATKTMVAFIRPRIFPQGVYSSLNTARWYKPSSNLTDTPVPAGSFDFFDTSFVSPASITFTQPDVNDISLRW